MNFKKVNDKTQATKKMARTTVEEKKGIAENYEDGMRNRLSNKDRRH